MFKVIKISLILASTLLLAAPGLASADKKPIQVGDRAPDFSALDQDGNDFILSQFLGKKIVVLYFYPKDETSGCTAEAEGFRDRIAEFERLGAVVIGVSSDTVASHKKFATHHSLNFTIVADPEKSIRGLYGVPSGLFFDGRVTYVIDQHGVVRFIHDSMTNAAGHVDKALAWIKVLQGNN
jgi:thioredoxin-dependent peroxiredoxin